MPSDVNRAALKLRSIGKRKCKNQIYVFDDYDAPYGDPAPICDRLGIPVTDDIILRYPAERTFVPLSDEPIVAMEHALGATVPSDYWWLLRAFGPCHLPGRASFCFYSPKTAVSCTLGSWWHAGDPKTTPLLAIASFWETADGDDIGFLRDGDMFAPELYHFDHERCDQSRHPRHWARKRADSLVDFIVEYIDSLK